MKTIRRLACASLLSKRTLSAGMLSAGLLLAGSAFAQSAEECPSLPKDSGLSWTKLDGADFTFCKAIRDSDGAEMFAVTIAGESPFRPARGNRVEENSIDGHEGYWYRSELATAPTAQVRETLVELEDGRVAHITVRADSEAQLPELLHEVEGIRFQGTRLSSK
jgi:hypothetical protein